MRNNQGRTLVELLLASGITAAALMLAGQGLMTVWGKHHEMDLKKDREAELVGALHEVLRVGRTAQWCQRAILPSSSIVWLECEVDRNDPPTEDASDDSRYLFGLTNEGLKWMELTSGGYVTLVTYPNIVAFEICDDSRMQSTSDPCPIQDRRITSQHAANLAAPTFPSAEDRFFRVQMGVKSPTAEGGTINRFLQSAFYIRHPNPERVLYRWGQWHE